MDLSYPIGNFDFQQAVPTETRPALIEHVAATPSRLREAIRGLTDEQLDTPYRPGAWTVRQVVHHLADSHMNSYIRLRFALTEAEPEMKGYNEAVWAELVDARSAPVDESLEILEGLHKRWVTLLRSMTEADFLRAFRHSHYGRIRLDTNLALYAWHGQHHVAHITGLRDRMGWG